MATYTLAMTIDLDQQDASFVRQQVERGGYQSPAGVVARALELLRREEAPTPTHEPWTARCLKAELQVAFEQSDRGQVSDWDVDRFLDRMHQQTRETPA